jgi:hypothetical protein
MVREPIKRKMATGDELLAKEMYRLSLAERNEALHDFHGIAEMPQEDPEMLARALGALEEDIQNISKKFAYEIALAMSPDYVRDPKFRLKFLRAAKFDPKSAAHKLVEFFEVKMELFGSHKLTKDIKLKDLSEDDLSVLESCAVQVLRGRDTAGRAIFCQFMAYRNSTHMDNFVCSCQAMTHNFKRSSLLHNMFAHAFFLVHYSCAQYTSFRWQWLNLMRLR